MKGRQAQNKFESSDAVLQELLILGGEVEKLRYEAQQMWRKQDRDYSGRLDAAELKRLITDLRDQARDSNLVGGTRLYMFIVRATLHSLFTSNMVSM